MLHFLLGVYVTGWAFTLGSLAGDHPDKPVIDLTASAITAVSRRVGN